MRGVGGQVAARRSNARTASANGPPPGTTSEPMPRGRPRPARGRPRRAHRARRLSPPPTFTTTSRVRARSRRAVAPAGRPAARPRPLPARFGPPRPSVSEPAASTSSPARRAASAAMKSPEPGHHRGGRVGKRASAPGGPPAATSSSCASATALAMPSMAAVVQHLAVAAHDARQPLAGELARRRPAVRCGHGVVRRVELPQPHVRVADGARTPQPRPRPRPSPSGTVAHQRLHGRAHGAGVDQLPGSRAGRDRCGPARQPGRHASGMMSVEVVPMSMRMRVRRSSGRPARPWPPSSTPRPSSGPARASAGATNRPSTVYTRQRIAGERLGQRVEHEGHPLALGAERLGQLGRHRDRVRPVRPGADGRREGRECRRPARPGRAGSRRRSRRCGCAVDRHASDVAPAFVFTPPMSQPRTGVG